MFIGLAPNEKEISHGYRLENNTAGVRKREDENRTREAGNRDEVEGVVANTLKLYCNGDVGFLDWLGRMDIMAQLL